TKEAERLKLHKDLIIDLIVFAAPIAIIFARIYYVIFEWDRYATGPFWKIFAIWEGGIAIHGALIGAVLTAIVYARIKKQSFWQLADIIAPSLILGQAIGRWGILLIKKHMVDQYRQVHMKVFINIYQILL